MMKKKLNLNQLKVSSFVTADFSAKVETVKGGVHPDPGTGNQSILGTCVNCVPTRNTCNIYCNPATNEQICFTQNVIYCGE